MRYYHVYTKGLEDRELFRDRDDFVTGMNILAVVCFSCKVKLLAFVLMSNHVHFVMKSNRETAERFIWLYKNLLSRYLHNQYGEVKYLHRLRTSVDPVELSDENLKRLIAYVLNNPVKAGINCVAFGYEWSSARCYFNMMDDMNESIPVSGFSSRQLRRILHSCFKLPSSCRISSCGYVTPQSYIDIEAVEHLFGRARSFEYFLSSALAVRKGVADNISFSDGVLLSALKEILNNKYGVTSVSELDDFLKKNLIKDMKSRFTASSRQLARVVGLSVNDIIRYLQS